MKRHPILLALMALSAGLLAGGCESNQASTPQPGAEPAKAQPKQALPVSLPAGNAPEAARASNKFAWALWAQTAGTPDKGNYFVSPASVSQALSMTAAGTDGATSQELWSALGFAQGANTLADQAALITSLNKAQAEKVQLSTANGLWVSKNEKLQASYVALMASLFLARVENLDFSKAKQAASTINAWVESKTNSKIKNLVPDTALNAQTRIVLTNAVYFKAEWAKVFEKDQTRKASFKINGKTDKQVDTLHTQMHAQYAQDADFQYLELPYKGYRVVFRAVLPKPGSTQPLDGARMASLVESAQGQQVNIAMPKFKIEWSSELTPALKAMGVKRAFEGGDFSPMFGSGPSVGNTAISAVIHKTFVQLDETGTEAAGATAVIVAMTAMPTQPVEFKADRPFVFQIVDKETGVILFMGRVSDPSAP